MMRETDGLFSASDLGGRYQLLYPVISDIGRYALRNLYIWNQIAVRISNMYKSRQILDVKKMTHFFIFILKRKKIVFWRRF